MGNRRLHKIECVQTLGTPESDRLKVTALNLFYPTASPPFPKSLFLGIATQSRWGRSKVGVDHETFITPIPTFPRQGGRQLRVLDPIARGTSPEGEGFPPSPKETLSLHFFSRLFCNRSIAALTLACILSMDSARTLTSPLALC